MSYFVDILYYIVIYIHIYTVDYAILKILFVSSILLPYLVL